MAEEVPVTKDKVLHAIEMLERRKKPRNPLYLEHLRNSIETTTDLTISVSKIVNYLACAGYNMLDIIQFLLEAGIVSKSDDLLMYRDGIRRVMLFMKCEQT